MKNNIFKSRLFLQMPVLGFVLLIAGCTKSGDKTTSGSKKLMVSVFAGSGVAGDVDGTGVAAAFNVPVCLSIDGGGNIFVGDAENNKIRVISPGGVVSTFAGTGAVGITNGPKASATFKGPYSAVKDAFGTVYVADLFNYVVRKIDAGGNVTTFSDNVDVPDAVAVDAAGNLFVSDGNMIFKLTPAGVLTDFAGVDNAVGAVNGTGAAARFDTIQDIVLDAGGNIYVADSGNQLIRKITPAGVVTTFAGTGAIGNADGKAAGATFTSPSGIALDGNGNVYVADSGNNVIRKIDAAGNVTTIAGSGLTGAANGPALSASFNNPLGITVDAAGNIYVADANNLIRKISLQ